MRILQLVVRRQYRGAEVFASVLSSGLNDLGHNVYFYGIYPPPESPLVVKHATNGDLLDSGNNKFILVYRLWKLIREINPDVIQCNGSDTLKYTCTACLFLWSAPPVVYRNISLISHWITTTPKRIFYRLLFSFVKVVVSVSDASRADFVKLIRKSESDVVTIKNVITIKRGIEIPDVTNRALSRQKLELMHPNLKGMRVLLHVGSMTEEKNHKGLFRILKQVIAEFPNTCLLCVGDGPLRPELDEYVSALGIADHVIFEGYQNDPSVYFSGSDLLLLTSHVEGIPGVVLEAASYFTPSVAYDVGGIREAIQHNVTGLLIEYEVEVAFCRSVIGLLHTEGRLDQMGKLARDFVEGNYNRQLTIEKFERLYLQLST